MKRKMEHSKGDLVTWLEGDVCHTGIVLESWDSNVYEPAECSVLLPNGQTAVMRSRHLKNLQTIEATEE